MSEHAALAELMEMTDNEFAAATALAGPDADDPEEFQEPYVRTEAKVGRNDPCPCGSGKKYKHCHGS